MKKLILLNFLLFSLSQISAQNIDKRYSIVGWDTPTDMIKTSNGNYIIVGSGNSGSFF